MQPVDDDVKQVYARYYKALHDRDVPVFLELSLDDPPGSFIGIGTPPNEEKSLAQWAEILGTFPPIEVVSSNPWGYMEDNWAWIFDTPYVAPFGDPNGLRVRFTAVLKRVGDSWKVVHWHSSEPKPCRWIPGEANDAARQ